MEDPKLILEQNIREMNDQVPKMNDNIATVKSNVILLENEVKRVDRAVADLTAKIKAAIQGGRDDIAEQYAMQLEKEREASVRTREQLKYASAAYDKALQVKKAFLREKERKIQEAKEAMRAHERAKWQARIADTLEQFEVAGTDQTHDEMIQRLREQTAKNEARMELALDSVDQQALKIEEDAEKIRASEIVKQFKLEMGMAEEKPAREEAPSVKLPEEEREPGEKTIGRERTRTD